VGVDVNLDGSGTSVTFIFGRDFGLVTRGTGNLHVSVPGPLIAFVKALTIDHRDSAILLTVLDIDPVSR